MKNVRSVSCENERISVCKLDLKEINNEDKYNLSRLHYLERVRGIVKTAERYCTIQVKEFSKWGLHNQI